MNRPRLGVNIDHVATLRQARGENYPSVVDAAHICLEEGADQITIHLREDRRHIQDTDVEAVRLVTKKFGRPLNLEMGCNDEIIDIAIATAPDWICLVPENRQERTTEGGLDLRQQTVFNKVAETCQKLRTHIKDIRISLFLEAEQDILQRAGDIRPDAIEIHTGDYARAHLNGENFSKYIQQFHKAFNFLQSKRVNCHAGHGLTKSSIIPLLKEGIFEEFNVGHWIVCQSLFHGLGTVVKDLLDVFSSSVKES